MLLKKMEQKKPQGQGDSSLQTELDLRTDEEVVKSIQEKRKAGVPLDKRELEIFNKQRQEDIEDKRNSYPH